MPIPLIVGGISAVAGLGGAKMASNSAKNAAKTQSASADKALALQERIYNEQRGLMQPYVQGGTDAFSRLMGQQFGSNGQMPRPSGYGLVPPGAQTNSPFGQSGQMVTVQAPTGETRQVPAAQAQQFVAKGARVIGG